MHLEINDEKYVPTLDDLAKDFKHEIGNNPERLYIFEYAPGIIKPDLNNPGRRIIPAGKPLLNTFNTTWRNKGAKMVYFRDKFTQNGRNQFTAPVYSPEYITFDGSGNIMIDLSPEAPKATKNIALVFWLLHNPNRGPGHYILKDEVKESTERLKQDKQVAMAKAMVNWDAAPGYIKDVDLVRVAKQLNIGGSEAMKPETLRVVLSNFAERNPAALIEATQSSERKENTIVMTALDYKVLWYDQVEKKYYFTYRPDKNNVLQKVCGETPFHEVAPQNHLNPVKDLLEFVTLSGDSKLAAIAQAVEDEENLLASWPQKGRRTVAEVATQINVVKQ